MVYIVKRDGRREPYDEHKVINAVKKALLDVGSDYDESLPARIASNITDWIQKSTEEKTVEEIQDKVENKLMASSRKDVAQAYIRFRYHQELIRHSNTTDETIKEYLDGNSEYWNNENSNKNARIVTTQRDYIAGITSTDITRRLLLPKDIVAAHDAGIIHFHDADYFAQKAIHNCQLINLDDMLQNGTVINGVKIDKPHRLLTAMTIATQIITAVSSSSYGGATISLTHLAPFVRDSYSIYLQKYRDWGFNDANVRLFAERDLQKEVCDAVQTFNYQVNSMTNTNGQAPFLSVCMYLGETDEYKHELAMLIEEFLNQRILGFKNEKGVYVTPAFPKLLYVLEEDNIHDDSPYFYLTQLAAKCTAKRFVPDYISEKIMKQEKINQWGVGDCFPCMGCRSFLTPWTTKGNISKAKNYVEGKGKYYGRFNGGVVTINLVDAALSSGGDFDKFWQLMDERLELCHRALRCRYERLASVTSDVAPILWQHGALARLDEGESIEPLLRNGYSTFSLGYAGLYECVKYMTGKSHTESGGKEFGLKVMQTLNDYCNKWKDAEDLGYSVYGTPIESSTAKFAAKLQQRFGKIEGITDRSYITNSYHVNVREPINAFAKLSLEAEFQKLSPGGAVSYVQVPNMQQNIPAVITLIRHIYNNIMYAEINIKSDYCQVCGYDGEIQIVETENGKLDWRCPNCGNMDHSKMNIARRTCGYIGSNYWNQGRTQEIKQRVLHL